MNKRIRQIGLWIAFIFVGLVFSGVYIEVESVEPGGDWELETEKSGFTGTGYFHYTGGDDFRNAKSDMKYEFTLEESGTYILDFRGRRDQEGVCEGEAHDQCNDIIARFDDKPFGKKMMRCRTTWGEFCWDQSWDHYTDTNLNLSSGKHTLDVGHHQTEVKLDASRG